MKYSLSCRHTGYVLSVTNLSASMPCPVCGKIGRLLAVELREYHVKCNYCSYGKWCGEDKAGANALAAKHRHSCGVIYERNTDTVKKFHQLYRRVKTVIIDPNWIGEIRRLDSGKRGYNQSSLDLPADTDRTSSPSSDASRSEVYPF